MGIVSSNCLQGFATVPIQTNTVCRLVVLASFLFTSPLALCEPTAAVPESPRLAVLERELTSGNKTAIEAFWREVDQKHTPLIEPLPGAKNEMLVSFLWRAKAGQDVTNISVYGEFGDTGEPFPVDGRLKRLGNSDVWFRTYRMSDRARFSYQLRWPQGRDANPQAQGAFAEDGLMYETFPDPLNPHSYLSAWAGIVDGVWSEDGNVRISIAQGPAAPREAFVTERAGMPRGKVETFDIASERLGNTRKISVYTPPGQDRGCARCDFLLLFDRASYLTAVPTPTILDNMQADGELRPLVAVLVGNGAWPARSAELPPNAKFQEFISKELLPWMRARYSFTRDPRRSVVGGSSFGGMASTYAAFQSPEIFGNVLSQSASHWWWPGYRSDAGLKSLLNESSGWLASQYTATRKRNVRFYMDVGTWEGSLMLLPNRMFRDVLLAKGYEVDYHEFVGGHDYGVWRSTLSDGLISLIGIKENSHP